MNRSAEQQQMNPLREGLSTRAVPQPCSIVIFGATGDLTHRKLIPALYNLAAARELNRIVNDAFDESQTYRIDHFLGKETAQNILVLRFANAIFEPLWNTRYIDHLEITAAETLGVESRAGYYETAGALRDMVQNHLLQLLCLVAMEAPTDLRADSIRDEKVKVVRSLRRMAAQDVLNNVVRGQYQEGVINGKSAPGYRAEKGVDPKSMTETFVALRLNIDNWR